MASPNLLQIKRSQTTAQPGSLANGELAFTASGNVVYIGNFGSVLPIAGERNPGILTANQALVANSTGWLNQIKTANATIDSLSANGSYGPSGSVLAVDGSGKLFWSTTAAAGPSFVQNTDSRTLSGNLYLSAANTTIENLFVTTINRSPKLTLSGDATGNVTFNNLGDATLNVTITNANGVTLGVDTDGDYVQSITAGNGTSVTGGTGESSTPTIAVVAGTGLVSNSTGVHINPSVTQTFDSLTVNGQTTLNGNVVLGDAIQDRVTLNGSLYGTVIPTSDNSFDIGSVGAVYNTGWFTQLRLGSDSSSYITSSANTIEIHNLSVNSNFIANTGTVYHDFYIGGDLHITGNAVFSNVESYIVTDPLIQLAANNTQTDLIDIGFFGNYNNNGGGHEHTGFFRDASDGVYKLFDGLTVTPTTFVDTGDGSYHQATLKAYLDSGALVSNSTALNITGTNSLTVAIQANTLTLSTALGYGSGGTGFKTYTDGDLLVGNTTSGLQKLTAGAAGYVLQSDGTNLYYGSLDGGSF
jgi:hypothetical protein